MLSLSNQKYFHFLFKIAPKKWVRFCQASQVSTKWNQQRRNWLRKRKKLQTFPTPRFSGWFRLYLFSSNLMKSYREDFLRVTQITRHKFHIKSFFTYFRNGRGHSYPECQFFYFGKSRMGGRMQSRNAFINEKWKLQNQFHSVQSGNRVAKNKYPPQFLHKRMCRLSKNEEDHFHVEEEQYPRVQPYQIQHFLIALRQPITER